MRARKGGWTALKQAEFIGHLAELRSVAKAARAVGMTREGAYRLRRRDDADSFNAAWDAALDNAGVFDPPAFDPIAALQARRKVTVFTLLWRVESGVWRVILRKGRYCGVRRKEDIPALIKLSGMTAPRGKCNARSDAKGAQI